MARWHRVRAGPRAQQGAPDTTVRLAVRARRHLRCADKRRRSQEALPILLWRAEPSILPAVRAYVHSARLLRCPDDDAPQHGLLGKLGEHAEAHRRLAVRAFLLGLRVGDRARRRPGW